MIQRMIREAKKSPKRFKHCSIVIKGGAILAVGYNTPSNHSEVNALKKLWPSKRKGTVVLNIRIRRDDSLADSRPCEKCYKFMQESGVSKCRVVYNDAFGPTIIEVQVARS